MDQLEFFRHVIGILEGSGLPYMVVGSFASGFWGEPRATYDVDVVIAMGEKHLRDIAGILKLRRLRRPELDMPYLAEWAHNLGVEQEWAVAQSWQS